MNPLAVIAAGGAVGAVARYLVMVPVGHRLAGLYVAAALVGFMFGMMLLRLVLA